MKLSKFYGITYPIFCLKNMPFDVSIQLNKILIQKSDESVVSLVDEINSENKDTTLLHRYVRLKDDNFEFDYTCNNQTQLINKMPYIKWGIDSRGKIHLLNKPQKFPARCVKVTRIRGNLIWVNFVSSPFRLRQNLLDKDLLKEQYIIIVYIDKEWVLKKFVEFRTDIKELIL